MTNTYITGSVVADSVSQAGVRLTTIHVRYPRFIHAELMTHRVFSRNARSSRAVPSVTLLAEEIYVPEMMQNQAGMQSYTPLEDDTQQQAQAIWKEMANFCQAGVARLHQLGVHKQWANRPLEWFGYIDVLISATDWVNFLALRDHEAAQPEIQELARCIKCLLTNSKPRQLAPGEWHLPYINHQDVEAAREYALYAQSAMVDENGKRHPSEMNVLATLLAMSVARCARISYKPFDGNGTVQKEFERYAKLLGASPIHASPAEHQATPDVLEPTQRSVLHRLLGGSGSMRWANSHLHGNLRGWCQHRKLLPNECIAEQESENAA